MKYTLQFLQNIPSAEINHIFLPIITKVGQNTENEKLKDLLDQLPQATILDLFSSQKKELFKIRNPRSRPSSQELDAQYEQWIEDKDSDSEGVWVYYPWSNRLIHILDKEEFIQLRTSRNHYKISPAEQSELLEKKVGIIGLSVGSAVAISMATERICGTLKLADFDTIELSNLNRLKTGIHNIGLNKCVVTAREIAEIDPFLEIECFQEGITEANLPDFLQEGGKLDILIDECDDLEIKISCRQMARSLGIPVMMETSDRGMLDVERFDLDNNLPLFHGLLAGIPDEALKNISSQNRLLLTLKIVDAMKGSHRGKVSLLEVGQSISTWPQLASAVTLGGGVVTDVSRRILLNQFTDSGRYYVDLEEIIGNKISLQKAILNENPYPVFDLNSAIAISESLPSTKNAAAPTEDNIRQIVEAGSRAPSSGNDQPWKWLFRNGRLNLFHDLHRSYSFANHNNQAANLALGAAFENVVLKSKELGLSVQEQLFPLGFESDLLVTISFSDENLETNSVHAPDLVSYIQSRSTSRSKGLSVQLPDADYALLKSAAESVEGAHLLYITDRDTINEAAKIIGECDQITMLNAHGHHDFFERDIKWTPEQIESAYDGISISALDNAPAQTAALSLIRDRKIAETLRLIGGGNSLAESSAQSITTASALAILTFPEATYKEFFKGGIAAQRLWLRAEQLGIAIQPLLSPVNLFSRFKSGNGLTDDETEKVKYLYERFRSITNLEKNLNEVFLFKISKTELPSKQTKRLPLSEILFMVNDQI